MRTAAIVNLKGGVGKSTTAINLALIMATVYKYRVLLNIINLRKKWKGICSQVPFIVLKYRQGCI